MAATSRSSKSADHPLGVVVIDYGMGNVRSVQRALERLGCAARISAAPGAVAAADAILLPGVGAFGQAMANLRERSLLPVLHEQVRERQTPILGICLGMQLFADSSEELGHHDGLGWIPGRVLPIDTRASGLSTPHVGWNEVRPASGGRAKAALFDRVPAGTHFYFDHSFHYQCDERYVSAWVDYGDSLIAAVSSANVYGVQFHPEKSQTAGLKLLRSFLNVAAAHWALRQVRSAC